MVSNHQGITEDHGRYCLP